MRKIEAGKVQTGMIVKDLDGNATTILSVSEMFDGPIGPHTEPRRARWGRVVTIQYADGWVENVPAFDRMYVYEEGE